MIYIMITQQRTLLKASMLSDKKVDIYIYIFQQITGSREPKDEKTKNDIELKR